MEKQAREVWDGLIVNLFPEPKVEKAKVEEWGAKLPNNIPGHLGQIARTQRIWWSVNRRDKADL